MDPNQTIDPSTLNQYSGINMGSSPMLMPLPYNYPGYNTQGMTPGAMQQGAFADQMAFYNQSTSSAIMNQTSNMMMRDLQSVLQGSMMAAGQLQATAHSMTQRAVGMFAQPNDMVGQGRQFAIETSFMRDVANFALPKMGMDRDSLLGRMLIGRKPDFLSQAEYQKAFELSAAERFGPQNKMRMGVAGIGAGLAMLPGVGWAGMLGLAVAEPIVEKGISTFDAGMYGEQRFREFHKEYGFTRFGAAGENQSERQLRGLHGVIEHHDTVGVGGRFLRNIGMDSAADLFMKEKFRYEDINKMAVREGLYGQASGEKELAKQFSDLIPVLKEFSEKMRMAPEEVGKLLGYIKKATGYEATSAQSGVIMDQTAKIARITGMKQEDLLQYAVQSAQQLKAMGLNDMTSTESILKTTKQLYAYGQGGLVDDSLKNGQNAFAVATELAQRYASSKNDPLTMMAQMPGGSVQAQMGALMNKVGGDPNKYYDMMREMRGKSPIEAYANRVKMEVQVGKEYGHLSTENAYEFAFQRLGIEDDRTRSAVRALIQNGGRTTFAEIKTNILNAEEGSVVKSIMKAEGLSESAAKERYKEIRGQLEGSHKLFGDTAVNMEGFRGNDDILNLTKDVLAERMGGKNVLRSAPQLQAVGTDIRKIKEKFGLSDSDVKSMMIQGEGDGEIMQKLMTKYGYKDGDIKTLEKMQQARDAIKNAKNQLNSIEKTGNFAYGDLLKSVSSISEEKQKRIQKLYSEIGEKDIEGFIKQAESIIGNDVSAGSLGTAVLSSLSKEQAERIKDKVTSRNNGFETLGGKDILEARDMAGRSGLRQFFSFGNEGTVNGLNPTKQDPRSYDEKVKEFGAQARKIINETGDFNKAANLIKEDYLKRKGMSDSDFEKLSPSERKKVLGGMWRDLSKGDQDSYWTLRKQMDEAGNEEGSKESRKESDLRDFHQVMDSYRGVYKNKYGKELTDQEGAKKFRETQVGLWSVVGEEFRGKKKEDIADNKARETFEAARKSFGSQDTQDMIKAGLGKELREKYEKFFDDKEIKRIAAGGQVDKDQARVLDELRQQAVAAGSKSAESLERINKNLDAEDKTMEKASLDAVKELTEIMRAINTKVGGAAPTASSNTGTKTVANTANNNRSAAPAARSSSEGMSVHKQSNIQSVHAPAKGR